MNESRLDELAQSLRETIAWCQRKTLNEPRSSLRTETLIDGLAPWAYHGPRDGSYGAFIESVVERRRQALGEFYLPRDLRGGRLLTLLPDWQLSEGACEIATNGYMDVDDTPPWDTWVGYLDFGGDGGTRYLLSWVPPVFLHLIPDAFYVSSTDVFSWLETELPELNSALIDALAHPPDSARRLS